MVQFPRVMQPVSTPTVTDEPRHPTVLQVLPSLVTGGVERGTVEITQAIAARAVAAALVASAGGRLVPAIERAGGRHVTLPLSRKSAGGLAQRGSAGGADPRRAGGDRACAIARAGLVGVARLPAHRRAFRHHLARDLRREPAVQAAIQRGDGTRRAGDRGEPLHRGADRGAPWDRSGAHPDHPSRCRSGGVRSGRGVGDRTRGWCSRGDCRTASLDRAAAGPADRLERAGRADRGAGADRRGATCAACWSDPTRAAGAMRTD